MDNIQINQWRRLEYHDPERVLRHLDDIQIAIADSPIDDKVKNLRTNTLKAHKEGREAALFCHGLGKSVLNRKVYFSLHEKDDYDFIACWQDQAALVFTPVQLKEVVPLQINPETTLMDEIAKLAKYADSQNLVVAVYLNRTGRLNVKEIIVPDLNIAELWFFGAVSEDRSRWFLMGDLLGENHYYEFDYPNGEEQRLADSGE